LVVFLARRDFFFFFLLSLFLNRVERDVPSIFFPFCVWETDPSLPLREGFSPFFLPAANLAIFFFFPPSFLPRLRALSFFFFPPLSGASASRVAAAFWSFFFLKPQSFLYFSLKVTFLRPVGFPSDRTPPHPPPLFSETREYPSPSPRVPSPFSLQGRRKVFPFFRNNRVGPPCVLPFPLLRFFFPSICCV